MENKEVNKTVNRIWKELKQISIDSNGNAENYPWDRQETLIGQLKALTLVRGAVEVMSKNSLLKLVSMQSTHRFLANHSFMIQFSLACDDLKF